MEGHSSVHSGILSILKMRTLRLRLALLAGISQGDTVLLSALYQEVQDLVYIVAGEVTSDDLVRVVFLAGF